MKMTSHSSILQNLLTVPSFLVPFHQWWIFQNLCNHLGASQVALMVKNPPANAGDAGSIPGQEDPLEKGMATHSSILEEEKLKFYITSCSFCLCNSACSLQNLDHVGHVVPESRLTVLGTGAYPTQPCPALCNHPASANLLNHACPCIKTL